MLEELEVDTPKTTDPQVNALGIWYIPGGVHRVMVAHWKFG